MIRIIIEKGQIFGVFEDHEMKVGTVKKIIDGRYCIFVDRKTKEEKMVNILKLRKVGPQWDSGI